MPITNDEQFRAEIDRFLDVDQSELCNQHEHDPQEDEKEKYPQTAKRRKPRRKKGESK